MPRRDKRDGKETRRRKGFYEAALTEAERMRLPKAREVEGLDEEIAMLRVRLYTALEARPVQLKLLTQGIGMLLRMAALRYRMSDEAKEDLEASIEGVLNSVGRSLGLGEFGGAAEK